MLPTTCGGAGDEEPGAGRPSAGLRGARVGEARRQGPGVEEWPDGSRYEGGFVDGLKHGGGRYTWTDGQYYEGSFYKDYRHGDGTYCWPTGHKFIGKFYLNRKEGYGRQLFPDGATFQGLYRADQRFGPGVASYPGGCQDVGLWVGERLLKLCTAAQQGFSLRNLPEYAAFMDPAATTDSLTQPLGLSRSLQTEAGTHCEAHPVGDWLSDENFIYPPGMESYSTDGDHLPLPPGRRRELDRHFHGELSEPDVFLHQGYERDPLSSLPLQACMQAHIHKHRLQAVNAGWDVAAVLSLNREGFGPKGPKETSSERLIHHASQGDLQTVSQILQTGSVHPDVANSQGHTALIAATVSCHNEVIQLLLNMGADVDKLNREGMSALAVCHVLYYPFQSLHAALAGPPAEMGFTPDTPGPHSRPQTANTPLSNQTHQSHLSDQTAEEATEHVSHQSSTVCSDSELMAERSIQVMDGHIAVGRVTWKDCRANKVQGKDKELTPKQTFDSGRSVSSYSIQVTEEVMQRSAEALSRTGTPQRSDTQETVRRMAAMKTEHRARLTTLRLLLERGADPNVSNVPMPVLFLAVMASDTEVVRRLLLRGARTDVPLPPERKGLYPLHVAAALPGSAGPRITELLLHAVTNPDARDRDRDQVYGPDRIFPTAREPPRPGDGPQLKEGGRTALHLACQRDSDYRNASEVVALLLSHRASTDLLCCGHSPLSLAIASGNDLAVEELLKGGADPNIPLGRGVGSALCVLADINYHLVGNRAKLLDMLAKAGANILMPVPVGDAMGTAVDYAHYSFNQDVRIANAPFHALNKRERETFKARRQLLSMMGDLLRQTAGQREAPERERQLAVNGDSVHTGAGAISSNGPPPSCGSLIKGKHSKPLFKFCYQCGRSMFVKLSACSRCHKVFYCSRACKLKAWDERHKDECIRVSASADVIQKRAVFKAQKGPGPLSAMLKARKVPGTLRPAEGNQVNLKENYSCN